MLCSSATKLNSTTLSGHAFLWLNQKALHGHMHYTCRSLGLSKGVGCYMLLYTLPSINSNSCARLEKLATPLTTSHGLVDFMCFIALPISVARNLIDHGTLTLS